MRSQRSNQIIGWAIVGLVAVIGVSIALSFYISPRPGAFYYPFFPFHLGWLGGVFLLFIVFWIARWFFWPWRRGYPDRYSHGNAESILRERYAKGEITKDQFEQMMRDLGYRS